MIEFTFDTKISFKSREILVRVINIIIGQKSFIIKGLKRK